MRTIVIGVIVRFSSLFLRGILQFMLIFKLIKRLEDFAAGSLPLLSLYIYVYICIPWRQLRLPLDAGLLPYFYSLLMIA